MANTYRPLTASEIDQLIAQGCSCDCWDDFQVSLEFDARYIRQCTFQGQIRIGRTGREILLDGIVKRRCGIYNATVCDCTVGDDTLIENISGYLANYDIASDVTIVDIGTLACKRRCSFGNGVRAAVVNEAGGREVTLFDGLTAQTAYLLAMYRHRPKLIEAIESFIARYVEQVSSARGSVGRGARLVHCTTLKNVRIGEGAILKGVTRLSNGTVNSSLDALTYVGYGVMARDFIFAASARIDSGAELSRCYVGEGVVVERSFFSEHSLFFANSHLALGEACSVFAGPFTVTHHHSTLLIAGYFSFFNAGSGANQSNHLYKTGPVHQGVHLRGVKFGSDAYVLLPARTGPFSVVIGRHSSHYDTAEMPFSYLVEEGGHTFLTPAANLRSYGTKRDMEKFPRRDKRPQTTRHDMITLDVVNPYTASLLLQGLRTCDALLAKYPNADVVTWNRVKIKSLMLKKGAELYRQALEGYLTSLVQPGEALCAQEGYRYWVDLAGMVAPRQEIERMLNRVESREIDSIETLQEALEAIHAACPQYSSLWAADTLFQLFGEHSETLSEVQWQEMLRDGESLGRLVEADAARDSTEMMRAGYGIDDPADVLADFNAVRGISQ